MTHTAMSDVSYHTEVTSGRKMFPVIDLATHFSPTKHNLWPGYFKNLLLVLHAPTAQRLCSAPEHVKQLPQEEKKALEKLVLLGAWQSDGTNVALGSL